MYIYASINIYIHLFIYFVLFTHTLHMLKERMVALLNLIWDRHCKRMGFLSQGKTDLAMRLLMEAWLNMEPVRHLKIAFDTHTHAHIYVYECMFLLKIDLNIIYIYIYIYIFIYLFAVRTEILIPLMHIWDPDQSPAGSMTDAERLQISNGPWEAFVCRKTYVQMQFGDISVLSACFLSIAYSCI